MTWLLNVYWFSLGIGGIYLLVAGALGAIGGSGHGGNAGGHALDSGGHDFDAAGHDAGAALPSADLDASGLDAADGAHEFVHGETIATHNPESGFSATDISPFNFLNMMCLLACFGGTGLALLATLPVQLQLLSFPLALTSGLLFTAGFHWLVANVLMKLQAPAAPSQDDMLGLEAEVIIPLDGSNFGEIAYTLDGQRYTSPARLAHGEHAGRQDPVTIVKVEGNTAYVETRRRILE